MSETLATGPAARPDGQGRPPRTALGGAGTWRLSRSGVLTVARLELRQRVRSSRWIIILAVWALALGGLAALIHHAVFLDNGDPTVTIAQRNGAAGAAMFGWVVLLVLALGSLVAPALSATSVNGDRAAGVLATLQATLLTPAEITVGKLLAAWTTALALLAVASPFLLWAYLLGGTPGGRLIVVLLLLAVSLLVECAIGLGWSALTARSASSAVLTYISVAFLGLGLPVLFGLLTPVVTTTETVHYRSEEPAPTTDPNQAPLMQCVDRVEQQPVTHYERIWWILAPNPFVVIADASPPRPPGAPDATSDVLSGTRNSVRDLRLGRDALPNYCYQDPAAQHAADAKRSAEREDLPSVWPYGLAANLLLGAGFVVITVRRLRAPTRRLPRGTRVA